MLRYRPDAGCNMSVNNRQSLVNRAIGMIEYTKYSI